MAALCMLAPGCGSGSESPSSRPITRAVVAPACDDMGVTLFPEEELIRFEPACFPPYFMQHDGYFLTATRQPVPRLERTCGNFRILVVFFDTETHRAFLDQNDSIPEAIRNHLRVDLQAGLRGLFAGYGAEQVFSFLPYRPDVSFTYEVRVSRRESSDMLSPEEAAGFPGYDAVLFLEDVPGEASGSSAIRWPVNHPIFRTDEPLALRIDPRHLTPGLFYNELFRRNVPVYLSQYHLGETVIVEENGIRYARTPVTNPRNNLLLKQEDFALLSQALNGWDDIDEDGVQDCNDTRIQAKPWNVDADMVPDSLDPSLEQDNGPYLWTRG
jgi:hypothetical protein